MVATVNTNRLRPHGDGDGDNGRDVIGVFIPVPTPGVAQQIAEIIVAVGAAYEGEIVMIQRDPDGGRGEPLEFARERLDRGEQDDPSLRWLDNFLLAGGAVMLLTVAYAWGRGVVGAVRQVIQWAGM